jgi:hypothetical protein
LTRVSAESKPQFTGLESWQLRRRAMPTQSKGRALVCIGLALCNVLAAVAQAQDLSFEHAQAFQAGTNPYLIAVGDFDGDGQPDLVTGNGSPPELSVLLGDGQGGFQFPRSLELGQPGAYPASVAVGDFNRDGRLDLVVSYDILSSPGGFAVFWGIGDGSFLAPAYYPLPAGAGFVAVGDFNGDGVPDLAVVTGNGISVFLGNGDGSFQSAPSLFLGRLIYFVAVGDFNGDGWQDLVVTMRAPGPHTTNVSVFLSNGDGTFRAPWEWRVGDHAYDDAFSVAVGDFNGDGWQDLAVTSSDVSVFLGNGNGTFRAPENFESGPGFFVLVCDFNGDGFLDLASSGAVVLLGNGDGSFQSPRIFAAGQNGNVAGIVAGDFNGDGNLDLAQPGFGNPGPGSVEVLWGNGDGSFPAPRGFFGGELPISVAVADFNSDGLPDLVVANNRSANVSVLLGNGDGSFQDAQHFAAGNFPYFVAVGDFNGDGLPDVAVANITDPGTVSVLLGNGDGSFLAAASFAVGSNPNSVAVGDFNRDGALDLAVAYEGSPPDFRGGVSVLLGNGDGSFQPPRSFGPGFNISVAVGDFNGDGALDLAVANATNPGTVSVLLGNGDGSFQAVASYAIGNNPTSVAVGDFNGDGFPDLAVAYWGSSPDFLGGVSVLLGNGDGSFQRPRNLVAGDLPHSVAVCDLNGDGAVDLAVANFSNSGNVTVLLGNGNGTFQDPRTFATLRNTTPASVAVSDFNGDGRPDLAIANTWFVTVLVNNTPR